MRGSRRLGRWTPRRAARSAWVALTSIAAAVAAPVAVAQEAVQTSPVVVTGTRTEASSFDLPMSIDSIPQADIQRGKLDVNVSEVLNRAPGTYVQNRDNFAQEQQISIRGFGARSQFGTRGVKLLADGIPASSPDGQGSPGIFDLGSADRIEVLRGPFSALYGNHSGGVVQIFTEPGPERPIVTPSFTFGSYDTQRYGFKFGGQGGPLNYVVNTTYFTTNGYREQSAAEKTQVNGKFVYTLDDRSSLTLVVNVFDQPNAEDPLGLTAQQVARNPRQATPRRSFSTPGAPCATARAGLIYDNRITDQDTLRVMGYYGTRSNAQYLAIPLDEPERHPRLRRRVDLRPRLWRWQPALDACRAGARRSAHPHHGRRLRDRERRAPGLSQQQRRSGASASATRTTRSTSSAPISRANGSSCRAGTQARDCATPRCASTRTTTSSAWWSAALQRDLHHRRTGSQRSAIPTTAAAPPIRHGHPSADCSTS